MINVIDIETFENENKVIPYCICIGCFDKYITLYNTDNIILKALNVIVNNSENEKPIEIYIHNLNFDGILIIEELTKNTIWFELVSDKTNLYSLKIKYCSKLIIFKCSYKLIPISLNVLGKIEKTAKMKFPHKFVTIQNMSYNGPIPDKKYWENNDWELFIAENNTNYFDLELEIKKYCKNDVILTQKVLKNIFKVIDEQSIVIRKRALSAPSVAHKIFYKKYNTHKISECLNWEHESYIRPSYFGGRCEVFGNLIDGEFIKYFDFSGMYGQCMLEKFHVGKGVMAKPNEITKPGFYNIEYYSNFDFLPILPRHYNSKLFFSNGKSSGTYWYEEILLFQKMGGKLTKINNALIYESSEFIFEDFVNTFNKIKEMEGYYKIFGKLMINSLYGGMALKTKEYIQYISFSEKEFENISKNTNIANFYKINSCFIIIITNDYKAKTFINNMPDKSRNVSYASAIASKARIKLYNALKEVLDEKGRLLYCDTDSIFAAYNKKNKTKATKLFEWLNFFEDGLFISPKTYALKLNDTEIIKIKGVSNKNITLNELREKFISDQKINFNQQLNFKKSDFILKQFYMEKEISLENYDKRIFVNNKTSTLPITIQNF